MNMQTKQINFYNREEGIKERLGKVDDKKSVCTNIWSTNTIVLWNIFKILSL